MQVVLGARPGPISVADLSAAYPWPATGPWVRAMMVLTLDGASVGADGRSRSISSVADRAVLSAVRRFSDVVLIGAGTFRAERYSPMRGRPEDAEARSAAGQAPAPVVAIVSRSLDLPWDEPLFAESDIQPIVVTVTPQDSQRLDQARAHADVLVLPGSSVGVPPMLDAFSARGLHRVVCEGGPRLLSDIGAADRLDEADISLSPIMTGGGQVSTGPALASPRRFTLAQSIADTDGFLFNRYVSERR